MQNLKENSEVSQKNMAIASILSFFFGGLGIDRFYLGNIGLGVCKLLTLGGLGVWSLVDFLYIVLGYAKDGYDLPVKSSHDISFFDKRIIGLITLGILIMIMLNLYLINI